MLSFIYQLFRNYQLVNKIRPSALFISHAHLAVLQAELETHLYPERIRQYLGMEVIVRRHLSHPKVCWRQSAAREAS